MVVVMVVVAVAVAAVTLLVLLRICLILILAVVTASFRKLSLACKVSSIIPLNYAILFLIRTCHACRDHA